MLGIDERPVETGEGEAAKHFLRTDLSEVGTVLNAAFGEGALDGDEAGAELAGEGLLGGQELAGAVVAPDAIEEGGFDPGVHRLHCTKDILLCF